MHTIEQDIEYFKDYKKKLYQFIIANACYESGYRVLDRYKFNPHDMLQILKEISRVELHIYKLQIQFSFTEFETL